MPTPETFDHDVAEGPADAGASCEYEKNCYTTPSKNRFAEFVKYDEELVHSILDDGYFCHIGFIAPARDLEGGVHCDGGEPVVLPTLYGRVGETLYLHGSPDSRLKATIKKLGKMWVCVAVTHVDALVLARSATYHGICYRSAVIYGEASYVDDKDKKKEALTALVDQVVPGRSKTSVSPSEIELGWTAVLSVPITHASAKIYNWGPHEPEPVKEVFDKGPWAGVLPVREVYGPPISASYIDPTKILVPDHIKDLTGIRGRQNLQTSPPPEHKFGVTDASEDT